MRNKFVTISLNKAKMMKKSRKMRVILRINRLLLQGEINLTQTLLIKLSLTKRKTFLFS